VRGHALAPGSYRLNAVASNVAGTGKPASTTFTVRGRAASRPRTRRPGSR
jgi:hypothetical protein